MLEPQVRPKDDGSSKLVSTHKENILLEFSNENLGALSEKGVPPGGFDDDLQTHVVYNNSDAKSSCASVNDLHPECHVRDGPSNINLSKSDTQHSMKETETCNHLADEMKQIMTSSHTPQQRPRSETPDAEFDDRIKRPATICDFFARGWCIKGNSCRFLHQKIGVDNDNDNTGKLNKRDQTVLVENEETEHSVSGLGTQAERLRSSTFIERSYVDLSSKPKSLILSQSLLSEGIGVSQDQCLDKKGQRSYLFHDSYNMKTFREDPSKFDIAPARGFLSPSLQEETSPNINSRDDNRSCNEKPASGKYPFVGKLMVHDMLKGDSSHDDEQFASIASPFATRNSSISQSGYLSSNSLITSNIYGNDKGVLGLSVQGNSSYMSFSNLPATSISTSHHKLQYLGTASSMALVPKNCSSEKLLDLDQGYFSSRMALPTRDSVAHHSVNEAESFPVRNMSSDFTGSKSQSYSYDWEPSVRFRSSFCYPVTSISSSGNQYDPLRDSIEPSVGGNGFFQTHCQSTTLGDASGQPLKTDLMSTILSRNSSYVGDGSAHSLMGSHESTLGKNIHKRGVCENATDAGSTGTSVACEENRNSKPKEEKSLSPVCMADIAEVKELNDRNSKDHINKGRHNKDSKTMKSFHSALVNSVKDLIKPSWREGLLSKDAHKKIMKKVVDKVLKSFRSHQIPNTTESIERYLSSSQLKLAKLVEGYIEKYGNPKT